MSVRKRASRTPPLWCCRLHAMRHCNSTEQVSWNDDTIMNRVDIRTEVACSKVRESYHTMPALGTTWQACSPCVTKRCDGSRHVVVQRDGIVLQRDVMVSHAQAIRNKSRKPPKAHTNKKRQPTNAGQQLCESRKQQPTNQAAAHASNQNTAPCAPPRQQAQGGLHAHA